MVGFGLDGYEGRIPCPHCGSTDCCGIDGNKMICIKTKKTVTARQLMKSAKKHRIKKMQAGPMKAVEELLSLGIERCPECNCAVGDDWEYKDFSNKTIVVCPQCGEVIHLDDVRERQKAV